MQNFLTHILSGYSLSILWNHRIYEIRCKRKKLHFWSIGLWRFNAWHWNTGTKTACTQWSACIAPLNKSATFFQAPYSKKLMFWYENNDKFHKMTTQSVRKKILHALPFKWTILIKYFMSYIKKCQTGTYFFGWVYILYCAIIEPLLWKIVFGKKVVGGPARRRPP